MNKIVGIIGKRYCLYRVEGECVLFDKESKCFVDNFKIDKEKAEHVLRMEDDQARSAIHEL